MMSSDHAPFYAGSTISEQKYFVGYQRQLDKITARTGIYSHQPGNLNIVGEKRIGKSSLLYHFCQTYEQRIEGHGQDPHDYLAVYIALQQGECQHKSGFYKVVAEHLLEIVETRYNWFGQPRRLMALLRDNSFDTNKFNEVINEFKANNILPILCLDKIEALFKHPEEFNNDFYTNLRYLMTDNKLMLVIASEKDIRIYSKQQRLTSDFFNHGTIIQLTGFTENEARDLVRLPQTNIPGTQSVLNEKEQNIALEWGGKNPYLLQLAGLLIWEGKQYNESLAKTKKQFDLQAKGISNHHSLGRKCLLFLKFIFWSLPIKLGSIGKFVGSNFGDITNFLMGWSIIIVIGLVMFKVVPLEAIIKAFTKFIGLG
jgi:hypothetical protein